MLDPAKSILSTMQGQPKYNLTKVCVRNSKYIASTGLVHDFVIQELIGIIRLSLYSKHLKDTQNINLFLKDRPLAVC